MTKTLMQQEAAQTPQRILTQLDANDLVTDQLGEKLQQLSPKFVMIVGRGSSDHAGVFAKYLIEIETGVPTFAAAPSVASVYGKQLHLEGGLVIVISQSGRSPDILAQAESAKAAGAYVIALVNDETSPLAKIVDTVVPLHAGEEKSVAATKSYLTTLSALLQITAKWCGNTELTTALHQLPALMEEVIKAPSQLTSGALAEVKNLVVLGRGLGYAVSKEIALKMKEVCSIHAEAFSSAEFLHGPVTLVEQKLTIMDIQIEDESESAHCEQISEVASRGAALVHLHQCGHQTHPRLAPLLVLQRFYLDVALVALSRGFNPDQPKGLKKVTKTL